MSETILIDPVTLDELKASAGADFVAELADTFCTEVPGMLAELHQALAAQDAKAFRRAAHAMKSNAMSFGAQALAEQARVLELGSLPPDGTGVARLEELWQLSQPKLMEAVREH